MPLQIKILELLTMLRSQNDIFGPKDRSFISVFASSCSKKPFEGFNEV